MKRYIKQIRYIDREVNECEIILSDGHFEIMCFAYPYQENCNFNIYAFMSENIVIADDEKCYVKKNNNGYFAYSLQGELISKIRGEVKVGKFYIKLENPEEIPKDIKDGEYIQFDCQRLDLDSL